MRIKRYRSAVDVSELVSGEHELLRSNPPKNIATVRFINCH